MDDVDDASGVTAGALLRRARQAQGLHIDALAAAIKIAPGKLELLEADRIGELPGAAFARSLALTVCRALKIDAAPVLALLPLTSVQRLEHVSRGLNAPFRERPGVHDASRWLSIGRPALWAPLVLLVAAAVVYLLPARVGLVDGGAAPQPTATSVAAPPADEVVPLAEVAPPADTLPEPAAQAETMVETVHSAPDVLDTGVAAGAAANPLPAAPQAASAAADSLPAAPPLQLRTRAESWIEVIDGRGQALLSRVLQPGETVGLDGALPFQVRIGNAAATELTFRGQKLDLGPATRGNVARLEIE